MLGAVAILAVLFPGAAGAVGGGISGTVSAANGTPAAGVLVTVCRGTVCSTAQAGSDGTYAIAGLAAGSYIVLFADALGSGGSGYYASTGFTADKASATPVVVGSSIVSGISVRLPGAAGAVGGGISGTVSAANGTPAAGVLVTVCRGTVCSTAQAGSDGTYAIAGLAAGSYIVSFADALGSGGSGYYASTGFTADKASATPVVVGSSIVSGISVRLPGAAGAVGGGISGTVSAANGTPAAGVLVTVCRGTVCSTAQAGSDGTYAIAGLAAGSYIVLFADALGSGGSGYYASTGFTADKASATPVVVGSSIVSGISVRLPGAAGAVGGGISGTVSAANGTPAAGVLVTVCRGTVCSTAQAGSDGTYAIAGLAAGSYIVLFADALGSGGSGYYASTGFTADKASATPVVVGSSIVSGISVRLPGAAGAVGGGISGTVSAANGTPAAGVLVTVCRGTVCSTAQAGSDGTYAIAGLAAGSYIVSFADALGSGGSGYYASTGFTADKASATPVVVGSSIVSGISVRLPGAAGATPGPTPKPTPLVVAFRTGTALGYYTKTGPFLSSTKVQHVGGYVTWKMDGGAAAAGRTITIYLRKKSTSSGPWGPWKVLVTRKANAAGVVYASVRSQRVAWVSVRPVLGTVKGMA